MTQPQEPEYTAPPPSPQTTRIAPSRPGCASRIVGLFGWIVTVLISAALAIAAAAAILFYYFGFNLSTPGQIRQSNLDLAALRATNEALQTEVVLLSTASAEQGSGVGSARERVDDLEAKVTSYERQVATAAALSQDLNDNIALAATIQAEARQGQLLAAVVATVQAGNTSQLSDLQRRTDRIARFLQRLGDMAGDLASQDAITPSPSPSLAPTPTVIATPTPTR
jgi:hypothetical protein